MAQFWLFSSLLKGILQQEPNSYREKIVLAAVTAVGQSISVINHLPTIFNRYRRANCRSPAPAERENLAFVLEFYFSRLESLGNYSK